MRERSEQVELDPAALREELREVIQVGLRLSAYATGVARSGTGTRDTMLALARAFEERARSASSTSRLSI